MTRQLLHHSSILEDPHSSHLEQQKVLLVQVSCQRLSFQALRVSDACQNWLDELPLQQFQPALRELDEIAHCVDVTSVWTAACGHNIATQ